MMTFDYYLEQAVTEHYGPGEWKMTNLDFLEIINNARDAQARDEERREQSFDPRWL